jgi:prepilin-type N-terminal cleavage/methylation domain-containing protein/prepilin-type processing-associated H-X9-DG protein
MYPVRSTGRHGITLIELIVVVAIVGILLALTLVAVQRVRDAALQSESKNNAKNIILAVHQLAGTTGRLPRVPLDSVNGGYTILKRERSIMLKILPYLEQEVKPHKLNPLPVIPMYLSPSDPTASQAIADKSPATSYAANAVAFRLALPITTAFADGSSNTIAFAEHYSYGCHGISFYYNDNGLPGGVSSRRATFADISDEEPETAGSPPVTTSEFGLTFQAAPSLKDCNPRIAQTPHSSGMVVAMADGSVRVIASGISNSTYWSLVTPNAGDVPGSDW